MKRERPFDIVPAGDGWVARVRVRGAPVLTSPLLNRGTAFSPEERRRWG